MQRIGSGLRRILSLGAAIGLTTLAHCVTPLSMTALHNVYQRLYYIPILAAAYWFGLKGALLTSLVSAGSYLPHIMSDWRGSHVEYRQSQYAELIMFQATALIVGALAESERRQRRRLEKTSKELAEAYAKLQESFEQVQRAQKLSALGQLSAGLAHEIRNPLASMKGSLEILGAEFPREHPKREFVEILDKELDRLNKVLTEFLQFARSPRPERRPCDLREVIDSIKVLCSKEADRQGVRIEVSYSGGLSGLPLDAAQIQQALLNIVLNGIQAMSSGGRLSVQASRNSRSVRIQIQDEGPGIPPEDRSRIFDPFFTTKDRGTGLGLSIASRLIEGHEGEIRVLDNDGSGTVFLVDIPLQSVVDG